MTFNFNSRLSVKRILSFLILVIAAFAILRIDWGLEKNSGVTLSPDPDLVSNTTFSTSSGESASVAAESLSGNVDNRLRTDFESLPDNIRDQAREFKQSLDTAAFASFLQSEEGQPSAPLLLLKLGEELYSAGCYSESLATLGRGWQLAISSKPEHWTEHKLIARIGARLGELYARLGRTKELEGLLAEMKGRPIEGAETLAFTNLSQALDSLTNFPEHSFKCGPLALGKIFTLTHPSSDKPSRIGEIASPRSGFSLAGVVSLGSEIGFPVKAVQSKQGHVPVPSVIHWRSDHYAAVTRFNEGRYLVEDPTFQRSVWMSPEAIEREGSGFFIIPEENLGSDLTLVATERAAAIFGKGAPSQVDTDDQGGDDDESDCSGLPRAGFNNFYAALNIRDTPLFYTPPVGPPVEVGLTYFDASNYDNSTAEHGHPGKKWILSWVRHIEVPQLNPGGATFRTVRANGKTEKYQGTVSGGGLTVAKAGLYTRSRLAATGGISGNPLENISKSLPDGSTETYGYLADGGDPQAFGTITGGGVENSKLYLAASADPQGNSLRFSYIPGTAKLKKVTDAIGQETTLFYSDSPDGMGADNPSRRLISAIRDPFGRSVRFLYDSEERLVSLVDVSGNETTFAYADPVTPDFITSMTTPYGTSSFAKDGTTLTLTDPEGLQEKVSFAFSRSGLPLAGVSGTSALPAETPDTPGVSVANGQAWYGYLYYATTLYWDKKTMRMSGDQTDMAHQTRWAQQNDDYSVLSGVASSRRPAMSHREWYNYKDQPNAGTIGISSQPTLRIRRIKDENGNPADEIHRYEYNANGYPTRVVDPLGREVTSEYDANGIDIVAIRRKRGETFETLSTITGYGYYSPHRPRYVTDAAGQTTELRWNNRGQLVETINPLGQRSVSTYDANGYLTKMERTDPDQPGNLVELSSFTYDTFGRPSRITGPDGYFIDLEYDALNRVTKTIYPDGTWGGVTYNALSVSSTRDRLGRVTNHTYNGNMQRVSTTDPAGRKLEFGWCSCGALSLLIDPTNRPTRWRYDILGRQVAKEYVDGSSDRYRYDPASGRLDTVIDAKGNIRTRSYYLDGQVAAFRYNNDPNTADVTFTYDPVDGRITSMMDGIGTTQYSYNAVFGTIGADKLTSVDGPLPDDTLTYTYDALGRRTSYAINGIGQALEFDALGRMTQAANPLGTFAYNYVGDTGRIASMDFPGGMTRSHDYHPMSGDFRLKDIIHTLPSSAQLSRHSYEYDPVGNIVRWTQINSSAILSRSWQIGYDDANQLSSVSSQDPVTLANLPTEQYGYSYDKAGNRLSETIDGLTRESNYNPLNQVVSQTGGSSTSLPDLDYEWDANNRLLAINYRGTNRRTEFQYDGRGFRHSVIEKEAATVTSQRRFVWEGLRLVEERDASGSAVKRRYFSQGMQVDPGGGLQPRFFARDHLGSVRSVISGTGTVAATLNFDPWGRRTPVSGTDETSLAFTGHWLHDSSGLVMAPYRAYAPWQGKWISRDPIQEYGGINLYAYVENHPVNYLDPTGLLSLTGNGGVNGRVGMATGSASIGFETSQSNPLPVLVGGYGGGATSKPDVSVGLFVNGAVTGDTNGRSWEISYGFDLPFNLLGGSVDVHWDDGGFNGIGGSCSIGLGINPLPMPEVSVTTGSSKTLYDPNPAAIEAYRKFENEFIRWANSMGAGIPY